MIVYKLLKKPSAMFLISYIFVNDCDFHVNHISLGYLTLNSNAPTAIPEAAPDPESPMKCSLPILLANKENPT